MSEVLLLMLLRTLIVPPKKVTSLAHMYKPNPEPLYFLLRPLSICSNILKILAQSSGRIPIPVSVTGHSDGVTGHSDGVTGHSDGVTGRRKVFLNLLTAYAYTALCGKLQSVTD